jgi:hypothetical protein
MHVMLSKAKNLAAVDVEILRFAQNDIVVSVNVPGGRRTSQFRASDCEPSR